MPKLKRSLIDKITKTRSSRLAGFVSLPKAIRTSLGKVQLKVINITKATKFSIGSGHRLDGVRRKIRANVHQLQNWTRI